MFNTAGGNTVYQLEIIPEVDKATQVMLEAMPSKVNPDKATVDARFNLTKETSELGELRLSDTAYGVRLLLIGIVLRSTQQILVLKEHSLAQSNYLLRIQIMN